MCLHFILLCPPEWATPAGSRRWLPGPCFRIPPLCKLPGGHLLGRTPGHGSPGSQHNSWSSRFLGYLHIRVPSIWVPRDVSHPHRPGRGMWRGPCSCGFTASQLLCLVSGWTGPLAPPGRLIEESVERSAHCGQPGHLHVGVFIGSGPGSLWLRGQK